jgi:hypothetical protein
MKEPADRKDERPRQCEVCGVRLKWTMGTRCNLCSWALDDDDDDESPFSPW